MPPRSVDAISPGATDSVQSPNSASKASASSSAARSGPDGPPDLSDRLGAAQQPDAATELLGKDNNDDPERATEALQVDVRAEGGDRRAEAAQVGALFDDVTRSALRSAFSDVRDSVSQVRSIAFLARVRALYGLVHACAGTEVASRTSTYF